MEEGKGYGREVERVLCILAHLKSEVDSTILSAGQRPALAQEQTFPLSPGAGLHRAARGDWRDTNERRVLWFSDFERMVNLENKCSIFTKNSRFQKHRSASV